MSAGHDAENAHGADGDGHEHDDDHGHGGHATKNLKKFFKWWFILVFVPATVQLVIQLASGPNNNGPRVTVTHARHR